MLRRFLMLLTGSLLLQFVSAQNNGILPLTGVKYFKEGVWAKNIAVRADGAQFLGNRIPMNKEIEFSLVQPTGFTEINKLIYAGVELIILSPKGDILSKNPNVYLRNEAGGFVAKDFKEFSVKFGLTPEVIRTNTACIIKLRFYDLKGKNQLRLEFPVTIARQGEVLQVSKNVAPIKSTDGTIGFSNGLKTTIMSSSVDTTIRVAPKMAYASIVIKGVDGSSIGGIFQGKESFWVYDSDLNEVKISDILLKQVKGAMENTTIEYTLKIPYRLKTAIGKPYTVRFRWEGADKMQVIDVVTEK